ncbi:hypothetical protein Cob_v002419 [Colletotrichum orbiculare MAFF 240422]|uniref:Heterokaryon incompatibility protein n=1 Tax=Colletotrichum orbiculare (strain 104-T / ATCC 96160 / CBS 514.97 / LARS 414 / MAFF 240422) TaxID=1213857 RepID=A0A484G3K2_COLOR|nr:hypothetical protein Cob_v002419 [Colletotrichum orbiculare MAFF 240422]
MADVYGLAHLVLGASSAAGGTEGFLGKRAHQWSGRVTVPRPGGFFRKTAIHYTRPLLDHPMPNSSGPSSRGPLERRGWTFQERVLARRFVSLTGFSEEDLYHEWRFAVAAPYSHRNLTFAKDKLVALSAVTRTFHERLGDLFLAGLWGEQLPRNLSWYSLHPGEVVRADADADSAIPSWTWASIKGGVSWSMATRGFRFDTTCRVIEAESNPVSDINPFGSVKGGHLVLEGWFRPATVLSHAKGSKFWKEHLHGGFYNLKEWPASSFYADVFLGTAKVEVDGDAIATAVGSLETEEDNVPDEMDFPVWCFVLGTHRSGQTSNASVVVLGVSESHPGKFERVGFVELELGYRSAEDFFADWDVKVVTIL